MSEMTEAEIENKRIEEEREHLAQRKMSDLRKILGMPEGRRFIWEELSDCGIFQGTFNTNGLLMGFQEGKRDRGLSLLTRVNQADRGAFARMQNEFLSEALKTKQAQPKQG